MKTEETIKCQCSDIAHLVQIAYFNDPQEDLPFQKEMYISTILDNRHNFFKRVWYGLRYIFLGDISKYGVSQEAVLEKEEVIKIRDLCNRFLGE